MLGVGFFHQSAPELIAVIRMAVNQLAVRGGQPIVNDNVHPISKTPKAKVEDPGVSLWLVLLPFLVLPVWNDLNGKTCKFFINKFSQFCASFKAKADNRYISLLRSECYIHMNANTNK